jgi:hypothetical protein
MLSAALRAAAASRSRVGEADPAAGAEVALVLAASNVSPARVLAAG